MYEHPAKHQAGTYGNVVLSTADVYALQVGGSIMSCPQDWAAKIHMREGDEKDKIAAQAQTIAELQKIVTAENKDKQKVAELRGIIGSLQEEISKLRRKGK